MSNPIPDGWELSRLDKYVDKFLVPMRDKPKQFAGDTPWVRIEDFGGKYLFRSKANRCVDELTIKTMKLKVYPVGTVLCSCSARLGVCTIAGRPLVSNQTFIGLVPNTSISSEFLYYRMQSHAEDLQKLSSGTTIAYLPREKFEEFPVLIPPLPEQQKITAILSTVDDVIEKTRAQIDKLKNLKTGMMQELLTKGIGHSEFKDSPLGKVPKNWEVETLINLSLNGISNGVFNDPKKVGSGYKIINVFDMYQRFGVDVSSLKLVNIEQSEFLRNKVEYGDVFFTRSSLKLEGIAYCNINLSTDDDLTYDGHLMRVRPNQNRVNPKYLAYFCLSNHARKFFMSAAKHSTMTTIGQADIAPLIVLLPPLDEQKRIVSFIDSVESKINVIHQKLSRLNNLKKALMQDLLTGSVRVSVINHQEEKMAV
jgi:type I restriction enzyme S subunit